jgi:hypothetical protein
MKNGIKNLLLPATYDDLRTAFFSLKKAAVKIRHDFTARNKLRQFHGKTGLLLNIGCGPLTAPGWINMDAVIKADGVFYCDVRDPIPLADGSVRHIHSEHFLPHLRQDEARRFFADCYRLLQPGGSLRFILPDVEKYVRAAVANDRAFFDPIVRLGGANDPLRTGVEFLNQTFRLDGYCFAWDYETLRLDLLGAGFLRVEKSAPGEVAPEFNIDGKDWWRAHESMYVNAFKE